MTYLEAVNKVLRRLRENTVSSVDETIYSRLIGEFVNDANKMVEDAWDWSNLRETRTITTAANQSNYSIPNVTEAFKTLNWINETEQCFMNLGTQTAMQESLYLNPPAPTVPVNYLYTGFNNENNGVDVTLYPKPNKVYTYRSTLWTEVMNLQVTLTS